MISCRTEVPLARNLSKIAKVMAEKNIFEIQKKLKVGLQLKKASIMSFRVPTNVFTGFQVVQSERES